MSGAICVGVAIALVGCQSDDEGAEGNSGAEGDLEAVPTETFDVEVDEELAEQLPEELAERGTVTVGLALGSPPDVFQDDNGVNVGWEVDLFDAAAQKLGLEPEMSEISFDSIIPGLEGGRYDVAFGQIGITDERMEVVDQVETAVGNQAFAAPADSTSEIQSLDDLCGVSVGVTRGSRQQEFATEQTEVCESNGEEPVDLQVYNESSEANLAMLSGRADLSWSGSTAMNYFVANSGDRAKIVGHHLDPYPMGGALPKDSEFSEVFSTAVNSLIEDGTYEKIMAKWGLEENMTSESVVNPTVESQ